MAANFTFAAIVLGITDVIACKEIHRLAMANQNSRSQSYRLSLHFETVVWVWVVDDPLVLITLQSMHACFLLASDRRVGLGSFSRAAEV